MTPDKPTFLDRGTILALVIILVFWFGWTKYMDKTYPVTPTNESTPVAASQTPPDGVQAPVVAQTSKTSTAKGTAGATTSADVTKTPAPVGSTETVMDFDDPSWSFQISSRGMGLKNVDIKTYKNREDQPILLGTADGTPSFATSFITQSQSDTLPRVVQTIDFTMTKTAPDTFVGRATFEGMEIEKIVKVNSATYSLDTNVHVTGTKEKFKGLTTHIGDKLVETIKAGFFSPQGDFQTWYVRYDNNKERKAVHKKDPLEFKHDNVSIAAVSSHYFALAVVDRSPLTPKFDSKMPAQAETVSGDLVYAPISANDTFDVKYVGFAGPKSFNLLTSVDENLGQVIDYGFFAIIAKPILWLLKAIQSQVLNWGLAIILLTVIVRLIVLPFNMYSAKSMKTMQRLQPEMARIRERYKDKSQEEKLQMNKEIMDLMKQNNANPVGGCLPMLIQLPPFLALYQVLGQSIELYRQPFVFWIHDLSVRDPYFVLPVCMGITMFIQQKITPTTMDPAQAKILQWMPVIFSLFMVSLPSGLTLYIFVSTLFGIIQQRVLMRDRSLTATTSTAKA